MKCNRLRKLELNLDYTELKVDQSLELSLSFLSFYSSMNSLKSLNILKVHGIFFSEMQVEVLLEHMENLEALKINTYLISPEICLFVFKKCTTDLENNTNPILPPKIAFFEIKL